MEELEFLISQFVDGELDEKEQGILFKELSLNSEARNLLQEYINLKTEISKKINEQISQPNQYIKTKKDQNYKAAFFSSVVLILIMIVAIYSNGFNSLEENLNSKGLVDKTETVRRDNSIENTYLNRVNKIRTVKITGEDVLSKKL